MAVLGPGPAFGWALRVPLLAALSAMTALDLRARLIPDLLTLPALVYTLLIAAIVHGARGLLDATLGAAVGGGVALLVAILTRGGLGGGDVKLMGVVGGAVGWKAALAIFALSQLTGGVIAIALLAFGRADRKAGFPVGALIALLGGLWLSLSR